MRNEVMEMHLFDVEAAEEKSLCGEDSSSIERISLDYYLEERSHGHWVGTVCQECKALAMTLAKVIINDMAKDLEAEGRLDDAEDCWKLLYSLARETGWIAGKTDDRPCVGLFCVSNPFGTGRSKMYVAFFAFLTKRSRSSSIRLGLPIRSVSGRKGDAHG